MRLNLVRGLIASLMVACAAGCTGASPQPQADAPKASGPSGEAAVDLTGLAVGSVPLEELRKQFVVASCESEDKRFRPRLTCWTTNADASFEGAKASKVEFCCFDDRLYSVEGFVRESDIPIVRAGIEKRRGEPLLETEESAEWQDSTTIADLESNGFFRVTHVATLKAAIRFRIEILAR